MTANFPDGAELLPAIVQDSRNNAILMLGYMNREAFERTIATGLVTFFSRSKGRLWTKGESSGNLLKLESITVDCDSDALLLKALPSGPTCHKGSYSCFGEKPQADISFLLRLEEIIQERMRNPKESSYTSKLLQSPCENILKKLGEELCEFVIEAARDNRQRSIEEGADLLFHFMLALNSRNISLLDLAQELASRRP